jgi:Bacterial Ig-like domain (group 2)
MKRTRHAPWGTIGRVGLAGRMVLALSPVALGCGGGSNVLGLSEAPSQLTITVESSALGQLVTPADPLALEVGSTATLSATALNALGQPVISPPVTWTSSDGAVATVTSEGLVSATGPGQAEISASVGGVFASIATVVTTVPAPPSPG